jgi:hypothetical protein
VSGRYHSLSVRQGILALLNYWNLEFHWEPEADAQVKARKRKC